MTHRTPSSPKSKPPKAPGTADAKAVPSTKTIFERLEEMGGVEVTSPPDGSGFVITGVSGLKRPKKGR